MISVSRITSIEYYEKADRTAAIEAGQDPNSPQAGRDSVAYYTDNGAGESQGVWWTRTTAAVDPQPVQEEHSALPFSPSPLFLSPSPTSTMFGKDGGKVAGRHLRDLAAGRHPRTKETLVGISGNRKRSVGFDVQMSAPKSVSILAAVGGEEVKAAVFAAHDRAVRRALDHAFDEGLISARMSIDGQMTEVGAAGVSAATYRHFTSRAKDPQLHTHAVLMNVAIRPDGTTGTLDNRNLLLYGGALAALYRAELAAGLKESLGVEVVRKDRNFEIAGITEEVIGTFSKRRKAVEAAMKGKVTETNRAAAQVAANETRDKKDREVSIDELEQTWHRELRDAGWTGESLVNLTRVAAESIRRDRDGQEEDRATRIDRMAREAIVAMSENSAVLDDRMVQRHVFEALQTECDASEAMEAVGRLRTSGYLVELGEVSQFGQRPRPAFSTKALIELERGMLRDAISRRDEREFVSPQAIEAAIRARPTMREDQAKAVRHALNRDGVSVVQGYAGTGKSFSMGAVAEVARACGREVYVVAPSWKATEVIRQDTGSDVAHAFAVPGFLSRLEKGLAGGTGDDALRIPPGSVVILDEAGMVGLRDMAKLVALTKQAGIKLVATGDRHQLQPVTAGAPLASLDRALGNVTIERITRQRVEWQRSASELFPKGKAQAAMQEYDKFGHLTYADDREAAIAAVVAEYVRIRTETPDASRTVLSGWNTDVRAVNEAIRKRGKAEGWIGADDVTLTVIPRGDKTKTPVDLDFAKGDEIIFGETVQVAGTTIRNADIARIESIQDGEDPVLELSFQKGDRIRARLSDLVGYREEGEDRIPKFQHASAMTVSAAQGVTVDRCVVANFRGLGQESAYVAMTRHRDDVRMVVDTSRVADRIQAEETGKKIRQDGAGKTVHAEEDDEPEAIRISNFEKKIKATIMAEFGRSDVQANASDFQKIEDFVDGKPFDPKGRKVEPEQALTPGEEQRKRMEDRMAIPIAFPIAIPGQRPRRPVDGMKPPARGTSPLAQDAETPKPAARTKPSKGRITSAEFDAFRRLDLAAIAEREGMVSIGPTETGRRGETFRLYQDPSRADGSKINIARWPDGNWTFAARDSSDQGDVTRFLAWKTGKPSIACAHELRDRLHSDPTLAAAKATAATVAQRPSGTVRDPGKDPVAKEVAPEDAEKAKRLIRFNWSRMQSGVNDYLSRVRGIAPAILDRFRAEIRTEPDDASKPWFIAGTACFAHRDLSGQIVGYERKGEAFQEDGKRSFSRMAKGSDKLLTMMGETRHPERIYVAESAVEALSVYQHDGAPKGALLCSAYGNPSQEAVDMLAELARRHPNAEIHLALNNDDAGREIARKFAVAVEAVRTERSGVVQKSPDAVFKDWNDQIRGVTIEAATKLKAERMQAAQEREATRLREEEARRKREQENAQDASRPRMGF